MLLKESIMMSKSSTIYLLMIMLECMTKMILDLQVLLIKLIPKIASESPTIITKTTIGYRKDRFILLNVVEVVSMGGVFVSVGEKVV